MAKNDERRRKNGKKWQKMKKIMANKLREKIAKNKGKTGQKKIKKWPKK